MNGVTKPLSLQMENSAITLYQISSYSSDDLHDHEDFYQISIPLVGTPLMQCNGELRKMDGQQRLVLSPGYQHRHFADDESIRMMLIFLRSSFLQKVFADKMQGTSDQIEFFPWGDGAGGGFRRLAETAIRQTVTRPLETLEMQELEWELASLLLSLQAGSHSDKWQHEEVNSDHPVIKRVIEFIRDDFAADISLDRLTEIAGISKYQLIRLFREHIGSTPSLYVTEERLKRAVLLLEHTKMDVTAVAFEVGFGSLSTFERAFKRKYGTSAVEYRKRM